MKSQNILKKTVKIACVTSVALGGAALVASGAALKALTEGAKFLKNTVQEILREETVTVVTGKEESVVAENAAENFAEAESEIQTESCV